ncbi:MAG: hypothetical protein SRB1_01571 [Desulfobacteraceae bacterium Eth-SRB1]|nr:MAG: hypothetical protein SRB1_01571 [Desulfobacteraceae bacterium Eth-SRB1]
MIKERKKIISFLVIVVILLAGGIGLGYYIWGMEKEKKPDYKKYLEKTINYIAKIENANQTLIKQTKDSKTDISLLKKKVKEGQDRLEAQTKTLQTKIASIQTELDKDKALLQSSLNENEKLVLERDQLKARIEELVNELDKKKASLQSSLNENEKLVMEKDQLKALILERDRLKAKIAELVNELDTFRHKTGDIKPEATETEAGNQESPVKEQGHPGMGSHQTESTPLIEQENN